MKCSHYLSTGLLALASFAVVGFVGCGTPEPTTATAEDSHEGHDHGEGEHTDQASHDHSGWWCPEHGVPEDECTRCDSSLIADFKSKEDWCEDHDRPDSQCFLCTPELEGKFAARYEAKFGEQPPKPTEP